LREGKEVKAIGKVYDARVEVKTTRGQTKVVQKTDIDLIADGTLWQLKTGPESLSHTWRFEAWLKQAMIVADQTGIKNIGFKFDKDAMAAFNSNGCKALWEHYKNTFKSYNWGNPVLLGTP
jgi:hypothetical protein